MRRIEVYADWVGLDGPLMLGVLRAGQLRDKEIFSFEYEKEWLTSRHVLSVDPGRRLFIKLCLLTLQDGAEKRQEADRKRPGVV
jgi:hypothetical protein